MEKVDILMATYNGELYIKQQIYSILSQTLSTWRLLVHDDGSNDRTVEIVKEFSRVDQRITLIEDGIEFGRASDNFMHLLKYAKNRLVIFCDQDDIWFENKLQRLVNTIIPFKNPVAVYCNAYAYSDGMITAKKVTTFSRKSLREALFLNGGVQGCSLMFNRELLDIINKYPKKIAMHDHFITIAALTFGRLVEINESLMFYRQHERNVTGNIRLGLISNAKGFLFNKKGVIDRDHYLANRSFYDTYKKLISSANRYLFEEYLSYPEKSLFNRVMLIARCKFKLGSSMAILLLKTFIRKPIS